MRSLPLSSFKLDSVCATEAHLACEFAGGRTILRRQRVGYPFHVTRGFYLDRERPELLTLYLQSASGGLYAGDRLTLDIAVGPNASLHLTTQAATVVHDGQLGTSEQRLRVNVGSGAFCAITSDPYILFPGADLKLESVLVVPDDAVLLIVDGLAVHDPRQSGRSFMQFSSRQRVLRPDGRLLLSDYGRISGDHLRSGPLGSMAAVATAFLIAPSEKLPDVQVLMRTVDGCGCLGGGSRAPNQAGLVMRILAPDSGVLARGIEAVFHLAGKAALGTELARRRK
jgi:urease accessory protein